MRTGKTPKLTSYGSENIQPLLIYRPKDLRLPLNSHNLNLLLDESFQRSLGDLYIVRRFSRIDYLYFNTEHKTWSTEKDVRPEDLRELVRFGKRILHPCVVQEFRCGSPGEELPEGFTQPSIEEQAQLSWSFRRLNLPLTDLPKYNLVRGATHSNSVEGLGLSHRLEGPAPVIPGSGSIYAYSNSLGFFKADDTLIKGRSAVIFNSENQMALVDEQLRELKTRGISVNVVNLEELANKMNLLKTFSNAQFQQLLKDSATEDPLTRLPTTTQTILKPSASAKVDLPSEYAYFDEKDSSELKEITAATLTLGLKHVLKTNSRNYFRPTVAETHPSQKNSAIAPGVTPSPSVTLPDKGGIDSLD